ncbi:NHL repeat-containing protein [Salinisphaera sp. P385]|uniref:NHL repeat-containing protein n=1 Tax=Spectribacter acetivorans TaxID=3075603 RepID=A0ABU3B5S9_9GAMM|nr:NHL repeat-containing protein [Salinisphaera sp. P385]MDT0617490.1 NHL repeat-containing protein [Salinisphaera sp. P385]
MIKLAKWLAYSAIALVAALIVLAWAGGAINWNQEPPYELVQSWGTKGDAPSQFNDPTGIAVTAGEVFVSDARNSRIQAFDKQGNFKRAFGQDRLGRPMNLDIADGKLYVPDYFKDAVFVFSLAGDYQRTIKAEDGFNSPGGVAVRADGTLLVADTYASRIVHIASDGRLLKTWGQNGRTTFSYPTDVTLAPGGDFYVADGYHDRIQQFGPDGAFVRKWGGPFGLNIHGPFKGWFTTVTSLAIGPEGSVFAADFYNDRIQKFSADGTFLTAFAPPRQPGPGHSEIGLAIAGDGTVYSANFKANRIERWESTRRP